MGGLADLLRSLRGVDIDDVGIHSLREANMMEFREVQRIIHLPLKGGGVFDWELADPNKLLQVALEKSHFFRRCMLRRCGIGGPPRATLGI